MRYWGLLFLLLLPGSMVFAQDYILVPDNPRLSVSRWHSADEVRMAVDQAAHDINSAVQSLLTRARLSTASIPKAAALNRFVQKVGRLDLTAMPHTRKDAVRAFIAGLPSPSSERHRPDGTADAARKNTPASQPESAPVPAVTAASGPVLSIPSVRLHSSIKTFYLDGSSWAVPPWEKQVGHLQGTAWLGSTGNIVLGGHSQYPNGQPGIFARLYNVSVGDEITLRDGPIETRYVVVAIRRVRYDDLSVVYPTGHNRLTLITCDIPSYEAGTDTFLERLVVIADAVG